MSQKKLIDQMSDDELFQSLIYSQLILFSLAIILSIFFFERISDWFNLFILDSYQIFFYGCLAGLLIVFIDVILMVDRKSTRLNSSHVAISYAVFCLKKKKL